MISASFWKRRNARDLLRLKLKAQLLGDVNIVGQKTLSLYIEELAYMAPFSRDSMAAEITLTN